MPIDDRRPSLLTEAMGDFGFAPKTSIDEGLPRFVDWYRAHPGL